MAPIKIQINCDKCNHSFDAEVSCSFDKKCKSFLPFGWEDMMYINDKWYTYLPADEKKTVVHRMDLVKAFLNKLNDPNLSKDYTIGDFFEEMKVPEKQRSTSAIVTLLYQLDKDYNLRIKGFNLKVQKAMAQVSLLPFEVRSDSDLTIK